MKAEPTTMTVSIDPALKDLVGKTADAEGVSMGEWVCRVLASALKRKDLAEIPRKRPGRRRKELAVS